MGVAGRYFQGARAPAAGMRKSPDSSAVSGGGTSKQAYNRGKTEQIPAVEIDQSTRTGILIRRGGLPAVGFRIDLSPVHQRETEIEGGGVEVDHFGSTENLLAGFRRCSNFALHIS